MNLSLTHAELGALVRLLDVVVDSDRARKCMCVPAGVDCEAWEALVQIAMRVQGDRRHVEELQRKLSLLGGRGAGVVL